MTDVDVSLGAPREVDWLVMLLERYDIPPSIHGDWPSVGN